MYTAAMGWLIGVPWELWKEQQQMTSQVQLQIALNAGWGGDSHCGGRSNGDSACSEEKFLCMGEKVQSSV